MSDPNAHAMHLLSSERVRERVSRVAGEDLTGPTPVSTAFGLIGTTGALLCP